ncbi:MAG: hypothetical protein E6Q44_15745 [Flavobacteriales bacterium]|nr:MAG: hypothetical protein E6Q44_15745 [Flavobacteriales bacterium]
MRLLLYTCIILLPTGLLRAQFVDPGFEQSGSSPWLRSHPEWMGETPSDAPYGGSLCMAVRATSQNFATYPYFYQALPAAQPGDVIRLRYTCRPGVDPGAPPAVANSIVNYVVINGSGVPSFTSEYQLSQPAEWTMQDLTFTVPSFPAGSTFGIGFGGYSGFEDFYLLFDNVHVTISGTGARLSAKAWLDGAYVPAQGLMRDDLRAAGLVPTTEMNTSILYTWPQMPVGETTTPAVLAVTGPNAIVDWVRIELRSGRPEEHIPITSRNALIQRDGDIVDTDGVSPVTFAVKGGNYYVLILHRNHLSVLGTDVVTLSSTPVIYDARSPSTTFYTRTGPENGPPRKTVGATRTLWPGNTLDSGYFLRNIRYTGADNDRDPLLYAVGGNTPSNTLSGQYRKEDVNMDGVVKYTGENNDRDIILQTIGGTTPTAVRYEQVPGP